MSQQELMQVITSPFLKDFPNFMYTTLAESFSNGTMERLLEEIERKSVFGLTEVQQYALNQGIELEFILIEQVYSASDAFYKRLLEKIGNEGLSSLSRNQVRILKKGQRSKYVLATDVSKAEIKFLDNHASEIINRALINGIEGYTNRERRQLKSAATHRGTDLDWIISEHYMFFAGETAERIYDSISKHGPWFLPDREMREYQLAVEHDLLSGKRIQDAIEKYIQTKGAAKAFELISTQGTKVKHNSEADFLMRCRMKGVLTDGLMNEALERYNRPQIL